MMPLPKAYAGRTKASVVQSVIVLLKKGLNIIVLTNFK